MPDYQTLYFKLFGAVADALEHMEEDDYGLARQTLISAQQEVEEAYIAQEDENV